MRRSGLFILSLMLLLSLSKARASQQDADWVAVKTVDGILLVWNRPQDYFTLEIKGKNIFPMGSPGNLFFKVDEAVLQVQSVSINEFLKAAPKQKRNDASILAAHQTWESQYLENMLGKKLSLEASPQKLSNGKDVLMWGFAQPKEFGGDAQKQLFLSMVNGDHVLLLNSVVLPKVDESAARKLLLETISTLKVSATKIKVGELQESIRHANP